jgi:hypothetical protein
VFGPALSATRWLTKMGTAASMFTQITQHYYPINTCPAVPPSSPRITAVELLSPAVRQEENKTLEALHLAGIVAGRSTRIGETNSVACSGEDDANPAFAGALWSLDWALRAADSGVKGLDFHGELDVCDSYSESPICAPASKAAKVGDVTAQPEYYGLLAARQLEGGRFIPTSLVAPGPLPNITTWATLTSSGTIRIVIDNLAIDGLPQPVSVVASGYAATGEKLIAPSIGASTGITLSDTTVTVEGHWHPRLVSLLDTGRTVRVIVPPASAVIVTLRLKRSRG